MNYVQADRALKRVIAFRDLYLKYIQDDTKSWGIQTEMARLAPDVQRDLDKVGHGLFILRDAPALGGREYPAQVTVLAYDSELSLKYHISNQQMLLNLERAIGEYQRLRRHAFWNLFNPLWWIKEILSAIVSLPFYLIGLAGFDRNIIESSLPGKGFKLLAELAIVGGAIVTIVQFAYRR